jgi:hypothetical protein
VSHLETPFGSGGEEAAVMPPQEYRWFYERMLVN